MVNEIHQAEVKVYDQRRLVFSSLFTNSLELGRRQANEPAPYAFVGSADTLRLVMAQVEDNSVSRRQMRFDLLATGAVRVTNLSSALPLELSSGDSIAPGAAQECALPVVINLLSRVIRVVAAPEVTNIDHLERLAIPTQMPGRFAGAQPSLQQLQLSPNDTATGDLLLEWLRASMNVFQSAASSEEFLNDAAAAVIGMVNLDCAAVLRLRDEQWIVEAFSSKHSDVQASSWRPSSTMLAAMRRDKATFRQLPNAQTPMAASLVAVNAFVAAPILDRRGEVIGALYGDRRSNSSAASPSISELEAGLVELLASGVAAGLARLEQEQATIAERVRFEQFFTPELTRQLELEPDLLQGRDADVTLLFCDIRRFSHFSERLGPKGTFEWINDVMEVLSESVIAHDGVLVDYIGDELIAMWGAPAARPDRAKQACLAAIDAVGKLPELNRRWEKTLGGNMDFGIGINSGVARVGNTGSPRKFKYGPLGNTVNLASRVQGATKHLGVRVLVTGATVQEIGDAFQVRRLCRVRVINIAEPVDLYELVESTDSSWVEGKNAYREALNAFEQDDCLTAINIAGGLLKGAPNDGPTMLLLSRAIDRLRHKDLPFDPVWQLESK